MPTESPSPAGQRMGHLLLTAFGLGTARVLPGTVASFAVAAFIGLAYGGVRGGILLCLLFTLYGVVVTLRFAGAATSPEGHDDPGWIVSDEVAGQGLTCFAVLPYDCSWISLAAAFLLFRIFDMLKPWPVSALERLPGPMGILLDDLGAAVFAGAIVWSAGALGLFVIG